MGGQTGAGATRNSGNYGEANSFRNTADAGRMAEEEININ